MSKSSQMVVALIILATYVSLIPTANTNSEIVNNAHQLLPYEANGSLGKIDISPDKNEYVKPNSEADGLYQHGGSDKNLQLNRKNVIKNEYGSEMRSDHMLMKFAYIVKVYTNGLIVGNGVAIRPDWVLSAMVLLGKIHVEDDIIAIETVTNIPEFSNVTDILIHPNIDEKKCNYDITLLKLENPVKLADYIGRLSYQSGFRPPDDTKCVIPAIVNRSIITEFTTILPLVACLRHIDFDNADACENRDHLVCVKIDKCLAGSPLICDKKLIGIMPTNCDLKYEITFVQLVGTYIDWIGETITPKIQPRVLIPTSKASLLKFSSIVCTVLLLLLFII